jgi:transposase
MESEKRLVVSRKAVGRYKVVSEFEEGKLTRKEAASALGISERQLTRLAQRNRAEGVLGLEHRGYGKEARNRTPALIQERIRTLASQKYRNFNYQHLHEMIIEHEKIEVSYSTLKRILSSLGPPKRGRRRKKVRTHRNRYTCAGLMMQMDGSDHEWVKGKKWVLIGGIDDATSNVPYGEFRPTEGLSGYLSVLRQVIEKTGVPRVLYVDHASFLSGTAKDDESGQFRRICEELGITLIFANSPQAKGRIERLWQTFQDRLIAELGYHGITEMGEATRYLNEKFLPETWNQKFTVEPKSAEALYRPAPTPEALNEILACKYTRKVRNDHTILWGNRTYQISAKLPYSLAKREIEIREYSTGIIQGYHAGRNLELKMIVKPEDRPSRQPIPLNVAGLTTAVLNQQPRGKSLSYLTNGTRHNR